MKKKIRIHRVENVVYGRYHQPWFKMFGEYLTNFFEVEWVNYATEPDQGSSTIIMQTNISSFGNTPPLSDVDCVIENMENNEFVVLSFTEYFNSYVVHYLKSDKCKNILLTHFSHMNTYHWIKRDRITNKLEKVKPWFFGRFEDYDVKKYRDIRINAENLNDKLFYRGSGESYRQVIKVLSDKGFIESGSLPINDYLEELSKSKIGLSYYMDLDKYTTPFDHPGEFCYRDIEYLSVGVPFIRIEYRDNLYEGLIPNFHYITIPREKAHLEYYKGGNEAVAELIINKYNEVIEDIDFLNFISKNQKEWFDKYADWPKSADFTINLSGINEWIN